MIERGGSPGGCREPRFAQGTGNVSHDEKPVKMIANSERRACKFYNLDPRPPIWKTRRGGIALERSVAENVASIPPSEGLTSSGKECSVGLAAVSRATWLPTVWPWSGWL